MVEIKFTFASVDEAAAFLAREPRLGSAERPLTDADAQADTAGKPRPSAQPVVTLPASVAKEVAAAPSPKPAAKAADTPPTVKAEPAAAPAEKPAVEYKDLQAAVFKLAGKDRAAASKVVASFGVATFKELPADKWADALTAVNAALAELGAA